MRLSPATVAVASLLVLGAGACGTEVWAFDSPITPPDAEGDADSPAAEASVPAEGGLTETGVPEAATLPESDADAETRCDADCASAGLHCDMASGECVECLTDSDCGQGRACESLQCVASCAGGAACPAATPVCRQPRDICTPCEMDADCALAATGQRCLVATGQCVECLTDSDCDDGYCSSSTNTCVRH